ncbi:hypothetical protein ACU8YE_24105, partial [Ralstonia sp. VS2407]
SSHERRGDAGAAARAGRAWLTARVMRGDAAARRGAPSPRARSRGLAPGGKAPVAGLRKRAT